MQAKKIAFIRMRPPLPYTNQIVADVLQQEFPQHTVHIIDVLSLLKNRKSLLFLNLFSVVKEYGLDILLGKKRAHRFFLVTSYLFKQMRHLTDAAIPSDTYFTFQMQSLFDASKHGIPHFVYTDHTVLANLHYPGVDPRKVLYSRSWIDLEKSIYQNADIVFTRSTNISHSLINEYGISAQKVMCAYAGSNIKVEDRSGNNHDYSNKHILFVGGDWDRKGGPDLVEAFKIVLSQHPDAKLTIVGCSPQLNLPNCEVVGQIPLRMVDPYYKNASVFCLPTRLEPFGIVFIEALAHQLPIVATNVGALPDMVHNGTNGYLVEPQNVSDLASALIDLIADPEKCRLFGQNGYELVQKRYSWDRVGAYLKENIMATFDYQRTF